jgi:hypothetical protein
MASDQTDITPAAAPVPSSMDDLRARAMTAVGSSMGCLPVGLPDRRRATVPTP